MKVGGRENIDRALNKVTKVVKVLRGIGLGGRRRLGMGLSGEAKGGGSAGGGCREGGGGA